MMISLPKQWKMRTSDKPVKLYIIRKVLVHVQNFGGVASRVPWGWRDSYGKTEILAGWVTKICLKCTKKLG